ncbi:MAG: hypothetical protein AB1410_02975 [Acidobacteriota bacterium]
MEAGQLQRKEIRLDLRKYTKAEGFRALEEKLCSIGANEVLISISDYDPEEIKKEVDFIFMNIWDFEKTKNQDGVWEAKWRLKKNSPVPEFDMRIKFVED